MQSVDFRIDLQARRSGFTLLETVIAIGVLAVLLTGFLVVFTPAADGIRKSLNVQQADRLVSALETELIAGRNVMAAGEIPFDNALKRIKESSEVANALFVYQYRGDLTQTPRTDKTLPPIVSITGKVAGKDYVVVPMMRARADTELANDLKAIEGPLFLVKCKQLFFQGGTLVMDTRPDGVRQLLDPKTGTGVSESVFKQKEAVIPFAAEFYSLPANTLNYLSSADFTKRFAAKNPVFTRNLAVRM
ncbi:MAG: type II secretion system protein [Akkermansiaceae bacterium]|nr:type II secretion system protein [Akkermansiaceae bacterium]